MFARVLRFSLKPGNAASFTEAYDKQVIPMLSTAKGFQEATALIGPYGNEIVTISLWDLKEDAEAYNTDIYPEVLKTLATLIEGTPHVRTYEVTNSTTHKIDALAAA